MKNGMPVWLVIGMAAMLAVAPEAGVGMAEAQGSAAVGVPGPGAQGREFLEFDVASIKEDRSDGPGHVNIPPGGTYEASLSLTGLIFFAYNLSLYQNTVLNSQLPDWMKLTRYEVMAKVDGNPTTEDKRRMMRALLAERFKLKVHTEMRDAAVMEVALVKPGKLGPTLTAHPEGDPKCEKGAAPPTGFFSPCGTVGLPASASAGHMKVAGRNVSISVIGNYLPGRLGRPIVDKTGLTGTFDFTLEYVADPPPGATQVDPGGPTGREAMEDQLGLKLTPGRAPVEAYVLDSAERPEAN